ncbi:NAD synthetase / Glutamine amidotransferase chain of NAD synthetase [Clostridiaceae bacterium JG1575]|nr:NAD synthetase / Glutamine amidotransferase chain of NAD synthetase [Clostridiaceae bacterium JG1575]
MNFLHVASVCPSLTLAHPLKNAAHLKELLPRLEEDGIQAAVFPELCLTGYTCGDLFFQERLLDETLKALNLIVLASEGTSLFFVVGAPLRVSSNLYNCAIAIQNGRILGAVPKTILPNTGEFYEKRWFAGASEAKDRSSILLLGQTVPFGCLLFEATEAVFGLEVCEDLWAPVQPSQHLALHGAQVIFNPSASNELAGKADYRRSLVVGQSARLNAGYVYASSGVGESTTDLLFSGHLLIAEGGRLLKENKRFSRESEWISAWIDVDRLTTERGQNEGFHSAKALGLLSSSVPQRIPITLAPADLERFDQPVGPFPFVPQADEARKERCEDIFTIQSHALARRLNASHAQKLVLGISGGLDSTLALLAGVRALDLLGIARKNLLTVTLPGFGTSERTRANAIALCEALGTSFREISIAPSVLQHFKDIGHDPKVQDVTYENAQARERTQILFDLANQEGALVLGTGDLSELALGFATYNGDQMSSYGINASIPKTLVRYLVEHAAQEDARLAPILRDILATPVSPELIPQTSEGSMSQKTEELIGPYELHDFFLYHLLRYGADPQKLRFLAAQAFGERYSEEVIGHWLQLFLKRFFANQFKRSAMPDGPKVGSIALSPRGDWRMPSDAPSEAWLRE